MAETKRTIEYLVADTTAFINAVQLNDYAKNVLTVPDVIKEVRNKRQIRRLCVLPFDLQVREPRTDSVKHCVEFAKKTGDYASLSGIDIKVISLTYELEVDNVGTEHLRTEPVLSKVVASKEKPEEFQDNTKLAGWYNPQDKSSSDDISEDEDDSNEYQTDGNGVDVVKKAIEQQITNPSENDSSADLITQAELDELMEKLKCDEPDEDACNILVPQNEKSNDAETDSDEADIDTDEKKSSLQSEPDIEDDDNSWITPANIKKVKKSLEGKVESDVVPIVACMSTDYALQNVLKQMNLQICALDGRVIRHLRTYILRCYACYKTTSIMTKVFCPNCGNKTLKRVAVSLDENGKQVIHINTRRPLTAKYKNQSLPKFQGGKHSRNPILFEDQPIPRQMPSRVAKTKTNALEEDYIAGFSPFVMRDVDSKSAMLRSKGNLKEWARNNTFEEDRRRKHYNRVYK
ncbi:PREDICTED: RNA-binding protein NOB1 [Rhagoletis zephyria]|uniref:RNA-binding protein NOB1 n=1 Tax=Rhagoletis zephyria TaxID=28612 RepID=UPI000811673E|nr:PREDICTED: RNA-binding protein NOB1 [Rhagoletis zephyria]XP_017483094.1 PREDICTED: RNA-binding protein NOB1 [Rhagoletis zephyria]XP_036317973.1 RNA-binding protein NOB1 [Rhagoletis pomonella]